MSESLTYIKPKIHISKCLEFDACRYDGGIISNEHINALKPFMDFFPICPEVDIGLGIPRPPIHIIQNDNQRILYQPMTKKYLTDDMKIYTEKYLEKIKYLDGFILKSKSPSCGITSTPIFSDQHQSNVVGEGPGIFTGMIINRFPHHPKIEDPHLDNDQKREHFLSAVFTIAEFRKVNDRNALHQFHNRHKYLFKTYNHNLMLMMEKNIINTQQITHLLHNYHKLLLLMFDKHPPSSSYINTQIYMFEYFMNDLSSREKREFFDLIKEYKSKNGLIKKVDQLLFSWAMQSNNSYIKNQSYFNPYPIELNIQNG